MSENREKLLKDIQQQGDLVRKLKAAKESAEKVSVSEKLIRECEKCKLVFGEKKNNERISQRKEIEVRKGQIANKTATCE